MRGCGKGILGEGRVQAEEKTISLGCNTIRFFLVICDTPDGMVYHLFLVSVMPGEDHFL